MSYDENGVKTRDANGGGKIRGVIHDETHRPTHHASDGNRGYYYAYASSCASSFLSFTRISINLTRISQ